MDYSEAKELDQATEVTTGEVRAAVVRVAMEHFEDVTKNEAEVLATDIIRDIFNSRERQWRPGDVARDDGAPI